MSVLVNKDTRLVVQGITGSAGSFHAKLMKEYGTNLVAGVTPGKGGEKFDTDTPIYNSVHDALKHTGCNATAIYVPPPFAADAIMEAADAGVELIICITEGIPVMDMVRQSVFYPDVPCVLLVQTARVLLPQASVRSGLCLVISISLSRIGVVSRSGTLTYEAVGQLSAMGIGQSTCIGIGGDQSTEPTSSMR